MWSDTGILEGARDLFLRFWQRSRPFLVSPLSPPVMQCGLPELAYPRVKIAAAVCEYWANYGGEWGKTLLIMRGKTYAVDCMAYCSSPVG